MRQSGYQQQFQIQQQRQSHFVQPSSQRVQTLPCDLGGGQIMSTPTSLNRKTMYAPTSSTQMQPRLATSPLNQRFSSPLPTKTTSATTGYTSPLSNSNLSIPNGQITNSLNPTNNYINNILNSPSTPSQATNLLTSSNSMQNLQFSKTMTGGFTSSLTSSQNMGFSNSLNANGGESIFQQASLIKDLDQQVKKLKEELETSRAIQNNTQKHNDELIKKIKVLINENEKMQQKEQEKEETQIKDLKVLPNIQVLLLENKRFQGIIRDLESKAKLLILDNEKHTFMLKQQSILQSKNKAYGENDPLESQRALAMNQPGLFEYKERCAQLEKKLELQTMEHKNIQNLASTWEQKLDLLLSENEKLQKLVKEKMQSNESLSRENTSLLQKIKELKLENDKLQQVISENGLSDQQLVEMETKFQTILEENNRINELLIERSSESDKQVLRILQLEDQVHQLSVSQQNIQTYLPQNNHINGESKIVEESHQEQISELEENIKHLQEENEILFKQLDAVKQQQISTDELAVQNEALQIQIQEQFLTIQKLSELNNNSNKSTSHNEESVNNDYPQSHELDQLKEEYAQQIVRFEQYIQEVEIEKQELILVQNEKIEECQNKISELIKKLEKSESKVKQLHEELNEQQNQVQQKTLELNTMKIKVSVSAEQMERCKIEIDDFNKQLLEKQIEVTQKQSSIDQYENQIAFITKEKDNLKAEVTKLNSLLQARKEQFEVANKNLQETRNELSKCLTNNYQLQQENSNLATNNQKQNDTLKQLEEQISGYEEQQLKQLKSSDSTVYQQKQSLVIETSSKQNQIILRLLELEKNLQQKLFSNSSSSTTPKNTQNMNGLNGEQNLKANFINYQSINADSVVLENNN